MASSDDAHAPRDEQPIKRTTVHELIADFARENPMVAVMFVIVIIMSIIQSVVTPHLYGKVVSAVEKGKSFVGPLAIVALLIVVSHVYSISIDWHDAVYYPKLEQFLRTRALDAQIAMRNEDLGSELESGGIITRVAKLPHILYKYYETMKYTIIPSMITLLFGIAYFTYFDRILGATLGVVVAAAFIIMYRAQHMCIDVAQQRDREFNNMLEGLDDVLQNMVSILSSNGREYEQTRLDAVQYVYATLTKLTMLCVIKSRLGITPLQILLIGVFVWRCVSMIGSGMMKTGLFVSLFFMLLNMSGKVERCVEASRELVFRKGIIKEGLSLFDTPVVEKSLNTSVLPLRPSSSYAASIMAKNVMFTYKGTKKPILYGATLSVAPGEHVVIQGQIGSGKSTLLKLFMRYHVPQSGELYLNGVPYSRLDTSRIRKAVAYVPQQPVLFNRTILENVMYGLLKPSKQPVAGKHSKVKDMKDALSNAVVFDQDVLTKQAEYAVWSLIDRLQLRDMFESFPNGLHTRVGKRGSKLSGGQRQIVWLLRVFMQDPAVLLLDEPTSALDASTKKRVQQVLKEIMRGRTVVMVTHDEVILKQATRIVVMDEGKVTADADKEERSFSIW